MSEPTDPCPCGGGAFADCCGPYLARRADPPTAEALMRSRFTAYARGDADWLVATHRGLGPADALALARGARGTRWTRLEIRATEAGGPGDATGTVEFVAHSRRAGRPQVLHEISRFARDDGRWVYVDGRIVAAGRRRARTR